MKVYDFTMSRRIEAGTDPASNVRGAGGRFQ